MWRILSQARETSFLESLLEDDKGLRIVFIFCNIYYHVDFSSKSPRISE